MATIRQQQLLDFAAVLADPNGPVETVTIGTAPLSVIRDLPALVPADEEGLLVERQTLYLLRADLGFTPVSNQELVVDGARWRVEFCPPGDLLELRLMRYRT